MFNFADNQLLNRNEALGGPFAAVGAMQNFSFARRVAYQTAQISQIISVLKNGVSITPQDRETGLNPMTFSLIIDEVIATRNCIDQMYQI